MEPSRAAQFTGSDFDEMLGEIIDRLTEDIRFGKRVDFEHYKSEFPDHIEQIKHLLPTLETMVRLGRSTDGSPIDNQATANCSPEQRLGDFRIGRELGRGGMGVVYEAEQISMGRRVAPSTATLPATESDKTCTCLPGDCARCSGRLTGFLPGDDSASVLQFQRRFLSHVGSNCPMLLVVRRWLTEGFTRPGPTRLFIFGVSPYGALRSRVSLHRSAGPMWVRWSTSTGHVSLPKVTAHGASTGYHPALRRFDLRGSDDFFRNLGLFCLPRRSGGPRAFIPG